MKAKNVRHAGEATARTPNGRTLTFTVKESSIRRARDSSATPMRVPADAQDPKSGGGQTSD
jgi:hypothetical protein